MGMHFDRSDREYVFAVVRRIVHDQTADDVTQEALLLAFRHRESFRGDAHPRTWLYRIATNAALCHLRTARRHAKRIAFDTAACEDAVDASDLADTAIGRRQDVHLANELLATLPHRAREVMLMRSEHTETETAARLGLTLANVKVIAHRARVRLRAAARDVQPSRCASR